MDDAAADVAPLFSFLGFGHKLLPKREASPKRKQGHR
jgi:hypothetical protein